MFRHRHQPVPAHRNVWSMHQSLYRLANLSSFPQIAQVYFMMVAGIGYVVFIAGFFYISIYHDNYISWRPWLVHCYNRHRDTRSLAIIFHKINIPA